MTQPESTHFSALQEVASVSRDPALILDCKARKVVYSNNAAITLAQIRANESFDKLGSLIDSVALSDREYVKNKYRLICQQPSTSAIEFKFLGSAGDPVWLNCSTYLFGDNRYLYVMARNITQPKQHEDYLVEFGARKNTLLDTLSHQLNGALLLMNNMALKAEKSLKTSDHRSLETFITLVHNNSSHCIEIINNLINKEHNESPGIFVRFSRTDVVKIVTYIFEELKKSQAKRHLMFETAAPSIFVNTDEVKLLQIVNNLASNSVKFTREDDEIRISIRETEKVVLISVADTGIGIPETLQPFVFEKYGMARRTGLNGEKSTGMGLSICKLLTELIGGQLWFESEEENGTTFFLEIPKD
jgi:two-component system sensor histidine kinase VicK